MRLRFVPSELAFYYFLATKYYLERPEIPLHTNESENDVRSQITRRQPCRISPLTYRETS
jgi:hypothetical protein